MFELGPQDCNSVGVIQNVPIGPCEETTMVVTGTPGSEVWFWVGPQTFSTPDGSEVYYVEPDFDLMAVSFQSRDGLASGTSRRLFRARPAAVDLFWNQNPTTNLVAALGDRFLFNCAIDPAASQRVEIVLNWDVELGRD